MSFWALIPSHHEYTQMDTSGAWQVDFPKGPASAELDRSYSHLRADENSYQTSGESELGRLLRRAAELAMALPNHAADQYAAEIAKIEAELPSTTEALRLTKQRVGQNLFRQALMEYWGGACAVTGLNLPEALRASHAKPWAKCDTDAERLDVFNGFLLSAHLDALFDSGLITFDDEGVVVFSNYLTDIQIIKLGFERESLFRLRWISPSHLNYLIWHRNQVFRD